VTRVLVIDDEGVVRRLMLEILAEAGYEVVEAATAEDGLRLIEDASIGLVVSDIVMPGLSGLELLEVVRVRRPSLPVVIVTGEGTYGNVTDALAGGADGFVVKPFSHAELTSAVAKALERAGRSERELKERLTPAVAVALANAIEARDLGTSGHCERLSALAVAIATRIGLPRRDLETVRLGAILHDVGKIGIPDRVLLKPGPFDDDELATMRTHPLIGDRLLEPLDVLEGVRAVVRHHHERWDGRGYPDGLAGELIPVAARVVAVADAIEAMTARRPYRRPLPPDQVVAELETGRGRQWDPEVVDVALDLIRSDRLRLGRGAVQIWEGKGDRPSVLLLEDDPDDATLALRALERELGDVNVVHATDVDSAARLCFASSWSVAVVDQHHRGGRGLDLLDALHRAAPDVPIVIVTGAGSEALKGEAFRRGASGYVVKDTGYLDELIGRVRALLERQMERQHD
jgi:putative two-component system response regulator